MNYCLPCFRKSSQTDEREPLLSRHPQRRDDSELDAHPVERGTVDKIVDILAAFSAGKLPSQAQLSRFLQNLLKSELLKEDGSKMVFSTGPMSKEGRKVLDDVRNLVQAILQFGLEKNDDDKLQEIYFQILQINIEPAYQAGETTINAVKGAAKFNEQVPSQNELAFDTATFRSALRALVETSLTSSVFRLILADLFAIARDLVVHTAADVREAALQVQQTTENVQKKAREDDELIMPEIDIAMDKIKDVAQATKNEWKGMGDDVKQKILERIKQVISRAQKDVASRSALRAILVLAKKYADRITSGADVAASAVGEIAEHVSESLSKNESSTSEYPPKPYPPQSAEFDTDSNAVTLLHDIKEMLERLGKGHSLDGLLAALKKVIRDLNENTVVLVDEMNKDIEDKTTFTKVDQAQQAKGKGKNKKKKGRKKGPSSSDKQKSAEDNYPLSTTESQDSITSSIQANLGSPLRVYFTRIGEYLDKGLDDPGWVMSKEGVETLEGLFDDGVELVGAVGESMAEVGEEMINPGVDGTLERDEDIRAWFKKDFKIFMEEAEAYASSLESDKTTMQIFRCLDTLEDDLSVLLLQGVKKGRYGFAGLSHWIGWAIPRLMQMVPGAIPIPSIEIRTKNIEGGLYALSVQGLAGGRGEGEGRFGTKLIPDEVVLKEWTEVRIDMAEHEPPLAGSSSKPGVQTTSRFDIHMDGIRAKVEGMGYYFKYLGGFIDYEDEGLLSVDVGMSSLHKGLGVEIEVEMENNNVESDAGGSANIPQIIIEDDEVIEHSGNRDIQEAVANGESASRTPREIITTVNSPPEPLFRVIDVKVALAGLKFKIDKSRHWILNKLFLQPLAGPVVARVVRQALEDKVRARLHDLALSLGVVAKDAKWKGEMRRERERSRMAKEDGIVDGDVEEGPREFLTDWWSAILQKGPMVLGYNIDGDRGEEVVETRTDVTMKGIVYSSTIKTTEQPRGTPVMVYNKASRSMEIVSPTLDDVEGGDSSSQPHSEEETVVAIGGGAQLFPGKDHEDQHSLHEGAYDSAKKAVSRVGEGLNEAGEGIERIEDRWGKRKEVEKNSRETWKSKGFDFQ